VVLNGRVDRLERHERTGAVRALDYKTGERGDPPEKMHLGPVRDTTPPYAQVAFGDKPRAWTDLQLPLYRHLIAQSGSYAGPISTGYFVLPRAVRDTDVMMFEGLDDERTRHAVACARGVLAELAARHFWPPAAADAEKDPFAPLFPVDPEAGFDAEAFRMFLARSSGAGVAR
jgi:ATP-dependent helicase/nuclease subunit B